MHSNELFGGGDMMRLLLRMRLRRARHFIRYHFDAGTLVRLGLVLLSFFVARETPLGVNDSIDLPSRSTLSR